MVFLLLVLRCVLMVVFIFERVGEGWLVLWYCCYCCCFLID